MINVATIPLFRDTEQAALAAALQECRVLPLLAGDTLLRPGESNSKMYVLLSGQLSAFLDGNSHSGNAIAIRQGECVGELSALDGKPASALVTAQVASTLLEITGDVFRNKVLTLPGVGSNLLLALAERMRNSNTAALQSQREKLELQHIRKELSVARQLQISMVPASCCPLFSERRDIDICGFIEPASEVGGDLFDCFFVSEQQLFFCIGDVSGHGIAAALFMAQVVSALRILAHYHTGEPEKLLEALNSRLCEGNDANIYVTMFCAYLDTSTGTLRYSNAGHCPPVLVDGTRARLLQLPKGMLLGAMAEVFYSRREIMLEPGELLVCYTDGVTEAENPAAQEFGETRLMATLVESREIALADLLTQISAQVTAFMTVAELADDCTMLALRRL